MLDKQLARAAVEGLKILFMVNLGSNYEVSGYITGMDTFHFMVIVPVKDEAGEETVDHSMMFVHKSAAVTKVLLKERLADEPEFFQREVRRVGQRFWATCQETYMGRTNNQETER